MDRLSRRDLDFLSELRVATEPELLAAIERAELELAGLREQASRLKRFRLLVGPLSGDAFEQLAIDALNEVLAGGDYRAEDREELRVEDFWILGDTDEDALAEAKGINRHVRREDVNQVDNHRAEQERQVEDLPGLLVVNVFRSADSMEPRVIPVNADVVRHAVRQNVLILRGIDLYYLVSRKLAGEDAGSELVNALGAGGGWLAVNEDGSDLRTE